MKSTTGAQRDMKTLLRNPLTTLRIASNLSSHLDPTNPCALRVFHPTFHIRLLTHRLYKQRKTDAVCGLSFHRLDLPGGVISKSLCPMGPNFLILICLSAGGTSLHRSSGLDNQSASTFNLPAKCCVFNAGNPSFSARMVSSPPKKFIVIDPEDPFSAAERVTALSLLISKPFPWILVAHVFMARQRPSASNGPWLLASPHLTSRTPGALPPLP